MRMCNLAPEGWTFIVSQNRGLGKAQFDAGLPARSQIRSSGADSSEKGLVFTARGKMQIHVVKQQVHGDSIFKRDLHDRVVCGYLESFSLGWDFQVLHHLENIVSNLLVGIAI